MDTTEAGRSGIARWLVGPALVAVVALTLLISGAAQGDKTAQAATGDQLRQITAATPACSIGVGLAFDGTHLILDCYQTASLWRVSPADGSLFDSKSIAGVSSLGALAWDESRGKLWACDNFNDVVLIDVAAQTSTPKFTSNGCFDGLAYDGTDDTVWASCDACDDLYHYSTAGAVLGHFTGIMAKLGNSGHGNSGIAVGGDKLYLANDGGSQIYQCTKDLVTCNLMSTFPRRLEDLECDNVTFAPKGAIWSIDAYDRTLNAWEIPAGTCSFGGASGQPTAVPTSSQPTPCIGGIVTSRCPQHPPDVKVTPTAEATATSVPPTPAPPTAAPPRPTATSPGGGTAGVITGPNTGSGPGDAQMRLGWLLLAAAMLSGGALLSTAAVRARRR